MSELDVAKEQIAYLKVLVGCDGGYRHQPVRVADLECSEHTASAACRRLPRRDCHYCRDRPTASPDRTTDPSSAGVVSMETVIAILLVAVSLVFLAVAVDATRYPK